MNLQLLTFAFILLLAGIFSIATSSIGIQCYTESMDKTITKDDAYKTSHQTNNNFLIVNLVSAILVTLIALYGFFAASSQ